MDVSKNLVTAISRTVYVMPNGEIVRVKRDKKGRPVTQPTVFGGRVHKSAFLELAKGTHGPSAQTSDQSMKYAPQHTGVPRDPTTKGRLVPRDPNSAGRANPVARVKAAKKVLDRGIPKLNTDMRKLPTMLKKNVAFSAFGVDHQISKKDSPYRENPSAGRYATGVLFPGPHGVVAGKGAGGKTKSTAAEIAGHVGGMVGGTLAGAKTGAMLSRNPYSGAALGSMIGGTAGEIGGSMAATRVAHRRGWLKPQLKSGYEHGKPRKKK